MWLNKKTMLLTIAIFGSISGFLKSLLITAIWTIVMPIEKLYTSNKRVLSRKSFTAIASVFYPVGMTKCLKWSLPILLNWCKL